MIITKCVRNVIRDSNVKVREKLNLYLSKYRRKKLINTDFSIISNNCWGGHVYRYFGLEYSSPTVGLYIWAEDYVNLLRDLPGFFSSELVFIPVEQSKYYEFLSVRNQTDKPIGRISNAGIDVEIVFLHYKNEKEAREKWNRRVKRVNYNNLIVKFSYQNRCNDELLLQFNALEYKKKFVFVHKEHLVGDCGIFFKEFKNCNEVRDDTYNFKKYINLYELINRIV